MRKKPGSKMDLLLRKQNEESNNVVNRYMLILYIRQILKCVLRTSYYFRYIQFDSESEEEASPSKVTKPEEEASPPKVESAEEVKSDEDPTA